MLQTNRLSKIGVLAAALAIPLTLMGAPAASAAITAPAPTSQVTAMSAPINCAGTLFRALETLRHRSGPGTNFSQIGTTPKGGVACGFTRTTGSTYTACGRTSDLWLRLTPANPPRYVAATCVTPINV